MVKNSSTVSAAPAPTAASVSYNQIEEYINKWTLELEEQEKVFTEQAAQINAWDQLLISNNQKILELNKAVQKVKAEQETLEQELEFISTQHTELEESIAPLQKEFNKIPQMDVERTQVYMTVENLDTQLKQMSEDLKEVIVNLNEANKCQDNSDPIIQIGKILNAHMSSLQWIENTSSNVSAKLDDLSKMHETFKRESERSFRSAYYN
uniref:Nucleoporin NSP1-like C-terminal domain-containing protein n=1 Tax=Megaselia scalaris TaxID=36166 RepID=T1GCU8_MEGSC